MPFQKNKNQSAKGKKQEPNLNPIILLLITFISESPAQISPQLPLETLMVACGERREIQ